MEKREWKHKVCNYSFWHTSVFTKKLETIAKGGLRKFMGKTKYVKRAQYILAMRKNCTSLAPPTKGKAFFPFEEDIVHHINEALVICSTGIGMNFFSNPFVHDWLVKLQPKHRPVYRLKLTRVIRCIQDALQSEVSSSCTRS